jgi:hypothetical protein
MSLFEKQIDHFGDRIDQAIQLSGKELDARIVQVGTQIEDVIVRVSDELSAQRTLTRDDVEYLIRYASVEFGAVIDARLKKLIVGLAAALLVIAGCWGILIYAKP